MPKSNKKEKKIDKLVWQCCVENCPSKLTLEGKMCVRASGKVRIYCEEHSTSNK